MGFLVTLETVVILLAMAIPGFIITKLKMIEADKAIKVLSVVLLYVCQPFITVNAFLNTQFDKSILLNLVFMIVITAALMTMLIFIGYAVFFKDKGNKKRDVFAFASSLSNAGYMAIPLLQMLTNNNSEIILYATASLVGFNLVGWTIGTYILSKNKKFISIKNAFFNLPTISFLVVLPFFIFNLNFIRFPQLDSVAKAVALFANMMAPVSMMIIGMQFSKMKFTELFNDYRVYITCFIKLLFSPLLAFGIWHLANVFIDLSAIKLNIIVMAAMPSATLVMMFSALYDSDTRSAAKIVLLSTLLSIATIPLTLYLFV